MADSSDLSGEMHVIDVRPLTPQELRARFDAAVFEACNGQCAGCGSTDKVTVELVVPLDAGGMLVNEHRELQLANGVLVCRSCVLSRTVRSRGGTEHTQAVTFNLEKDLYLQVQRHLNAADGHRSFGALLRFLFADYLEYPQRYPDLEAQPEPSDSTIMTRVHAWVSEDQHSALKTALGHTTLTLTAAARGLLSIYLETVNVPR